MYNPQLDTFIKAADAGSFSKAAEILYITPTAVIKQINSLEASLGIKLFNRSHRGLTLTEAGKSLYQDARYIIQYSKDSLVRARNAMSGGDSVIRIGTSVMTPAQFMLTLWPEIQEKNPELKFQLVSFENTPENAREILANLGQNIDIVAGVFSDDFLKQRKCQALELSRQPVCVALSVHHPLAEKKSLTVSDLAGQNLMLIHRGWNQYIDVLRDELWKNHPEINLVDFDFYDISVFNQCENSSNLLMAIPDWDSIHPLLKILPVEWDYTIPFGILYSNTPSKAVRELIRTTAEACGIVK